MKFFNILNKALINTILGTSLIIVSSDTVFAQSEESSIFLETLLGASILEEVFPFMLGDSTTVIFDASFNNTLIRNTSGKFKDWLGEPTSETFSIPATSISLVNKRPIINFKVDTALYAVEEEAIFNFSEQLINNTDNIIELMWVIPVGTTFVYEIAFPSSSIESYLRLNSVKKPFWKTGIDLDADGIVDEELLWNSNNHLDLFQYSDGGSEYFIQSTNLTVVPEPLTIFGVGTAIAFGTGFKHKLAKAKKK